MQKPTAAHGCRLFLFSPCMSGAITYAKPSASKRMKIMKQLKQLKDQRADLYRKMAAILETAEARSDAKMTAEEVRDFDALEKQFEELTERIERLEGQAQREKELKRARMFPEDYGQPETKSLAAGIKGFSTRSDSLSEADFFRCLATKDFGPLKDYRAENRGAVIGTGAAGGWALPEVSRLAVLDGLLQDQGIFSRIGKEFPAEGSDTLNVITYENQDVDDEGLFGFSTPVFVPESGTITAGTPRMIKRTWTLKKMTAESKISLEAATNRRLGSSLTEALRGVLKFGLEKYAISGTGASQPVGLIDAECSVTRTRATANQIAYADIYNMVSTTRPGPGACWIASQTIIPQLAAAVDSGNHAIWMPGVSGGAAQAIPQTLMGYPILFNIGLSPSLGSKGDLMFCSDLSFYKAVIWKDIFIQTSESASWSTGELNVRLIVLCDMGPLPSKPISVGGETYGFHTILSA